MTVTPTNAEKIRRLPWLLAFSSANTVFCLFTVFGSVFILFLDELGLPKGKIGLTLSLMPFCGILALFVAPMTARVGFKRSFLIFFAARKIIIALLIFTPWVLLHYGPYAAFIYVEIVVLLFAVCRAIAETSFNPWAQEMIPDSIRGKFSAVESIVTLAVGLAAVGVASYVIAHTAGLGGFIALIGIGVLFGLLSLCFAFFIAGGGASVASAEPESTHLKKMIKSLGDRNFLLFIVGVALVNFGTIALVSFLPLYMKEQIGLDSGNVVLLGAGSMVGGMLSCYLWGWAADRFGSKPVMLTGLNLSLLLPLCWWLMPRNSPWSNSTAMILAVIWGIVSYGWHIGFLRHLFVSMVPRAKRTEYLAIYYASAGLAAGSAPLLMGHLLDACKGLQGRWFLFSLDEYTPLFAGSLALLFAAARVLSRVHADGSISPGRFAGMFFQGNPLLAFESLIRYRLARNEEARMSVTERLAEARSPLNVEEILNTLSDPSFNVRYQAITALARRRPDARLTDALVKILQGGVPDLSIAAASTLGRIGDRRAIPELRKALVSGYPLLEARSARALAMLGDTGAIPILLDRLHREPEEGTRIAYASALGALRCSDAAGELLALLHHAGSETSQGELALAVARAFGAEAYFIRLWRDAASEPGTTISRTLASLGKRAALLPISCAGELSELMEQCRDAFAGHDLKSGSQLLARILRRLHTNEIGKPCRTLLADCAERLDEFSDSRTEYLLLALHAIKMALEAPRCA